MPDLPRQHPPATQAAIAEALTRVEAALRAGRLISSSEAMALAGPGARGKETLYSIARDVAWAASVEVDDVLQGLVEHHPELA